MADLLLELFSEEIPARMQKDALEFLCKKLEEALGKQAKGFVTPRRVAAIVGDIPATQPDVNTELKGPKVGAPEQAIQGFLKKSGMTLGELQQVDGVYVAKIHQKGKPTAEILKPLIEDILKSFPWPKSMRWGNHDVTWVRPLHSILCIFDGKVVPVEFGPVKAGDITYGHRFLAPKAITIKKADTYEAALEKAYVIADRNKRKAEILKQAEAAANKLGLELKNDIGLLEEVTGLVEWPTVLVGTIDAKYMDLPKEVLVSEMRAHQKYFALTKKDGSLADKFLITANMKDADKNIIAGNERVLRARLADGRFFWDQDRKKTLEEMAKGLASVTYHAKLGSVADKVERITQLALILSDYVGGANKEHVKKAAQLCKADLVSGMVGEFPELQGVMGRYYALEQKLESVIADAIRDQYKPLGPNDDLPTNPVSICLSLAEKFDTLLCMRSMEETLPTGSKDPYAVRRAMLGINRIIQESELRIPLHAFPERIFGQVTQSKFNIIRDNYIHRLKIKDSGKVIFVLGSDLLDFAADRLKVQLKDKGIRHDVINAVLATGDDDLVRVVKRAEAVQNFLNTDDGKNLLAAYKRSANILAIEQKKDDETYLFHELAIEKLKEPLEIALAKLLKEKSVEAGAMLRNEQFVEAMVELSKVRSSVDEFFTKILVNCEDKDLRINRLRLLSQIRRTMDAVADFSLIEGDAKEQKKAA